MPRGRQTRTLQPSQIERLEMFKRAPHEGAAHGYSLPQLRSAMGLGCSWETLQKALQGRAVWDQHCDYIAQWIERYLPAAVSDFVPREHDHRNGVKRCPACHPSLAQPEKSSEGAASSTTTAIPSSSQRDDASGDAASEEDFSNVKSDEKAAGADGVIRRPR
jgi:hypothetical protein